MTEDKLGYSIFNGTIADMTWMEVEQAAKNNAIMIVPIGVIEQHGPHLPLATDTYGAYILSLLTKKELEKQNIPTVIAPPYYYGITHATRMYPGSVNVSSESMTTILTEILLSYMNSGFKKQFIMSHHGESAHNLSIFKAMRNAKEKGVEAVFVAAGSLIKITVPSNQEILPRSSLLLAEASEETKEAYQRLLKSKMDPHAGERETSLIMRWFNDTLKDEERIGSYEPVIQTYEEFIQSARSNWREHYPEGYVGEPHLAMREKGDIYSYEAVDAARAIKEYLKEHSHP
jgi:creatinine amidohydrolase